MHAKIWGECTDALQIMMAHEMRYEENIQNKDLIWLLNTIKEISSGLDRLGNEHGTYYNSLKMFVLMWMGDTQSEDFYVKRVNLSIETLILAGGKGALLCNETIADEDKANHTEK